MDTNRTLQMMLTATEISDEAKAETVSGSKAEKKSGKRIGYNYIIVKSLKESKKNDVVKCFYIRSWRDFGFCVVKEGTAGDTKDRYGRDIIDRLIWQEKLHKVLGNKLRVPRFIASFRENGNFYLVIQNIRGVPLFEKMRQYRHTLRSATQYNERPTTELIGYLLQIASLLQLLHEQEYVHRDVTPANFIVSPSGRVYMIDMELSYGLDNFLENPFQLGTNGYMSPEQLQRKSPATNQDVFALGAIMLQAFSLVHPLKVVEASPAEINEKVQFLIDDQLLADLIIQCLNHDPDRRPTLTVIKSVLAAYEGDLKDGISRRPIKYKTFYTKEQIRDTIQHSLKTLVSPLFYDEEGWFTNKLLLNSEKRDGKEGKVWYASFSRGAAGIMYVLGHAAQAGFDMDYIMPAMERGLHVIEKRYISRLSGAKSGLYDGGSGIAMTLALLIENGFIENSGMAEEWVELLLRGKVESSTLSTGWSGQGMANLRCMAYLQPDVVAERLKFYVANLLAAQQKDGSWIRRAANGKVKRDPGLFNGIAGIVVFLIEYSRLFYNYETRAAAENGLRWLMKNSRSTKSGIIWKYGSKEEYSYGLSNGTSGVALTMLKAYQVFGNEAYRSFAQQILTSLDPAFLGDNLSQATGLCGLGEVCLDAFMILKDEQWLRKAEKIAQLAMCLRKTHDKYGDYWLVGSEKFPIPDFMYGNSGVVHFLIRYLNPGHSAFPLLHLGK